MSEPMPLLEAIGRVQDGAQEAYHHTWLIITAGAESNGEYSNELIYQMIENQQKIASDLEMLATLVGNLTEQLQQFHKQEFMF